MKIYDDRGDGSAGTDFGSASDASGGRVHVGIAESAVATDGEVLTTRGLGSCVGVVLVDDRVDVRGIVHVMLPSGADKEVDSPGKFADTGIEHLLTEMETAGADGRRIRAKIVGGSDMLDLSVGDENVGHRNVEAVREALDEQGIELVAEDVGGERGRSIELEPTGDLLVEVAHGDDRRL